MAEITDAYPGDKTLDFTVRTPAGHPHEFSFKGNTRVDKAARHAERVESRVLGATMGS